MFDPTLGAILRTFSKNILILLILLCNTLFFQTKYLFDHTLGTTIECLLDSQGCLILLELIEI